MTTPQPENKVVQLTQGAVNAIPAQPPTPAVDGTGGDDHFPTMNERLARIEATVDGLRRSQDMTLLAVIGVGAILAALIVYGFTRADMLSASQADLADRIGGLRTEISSDIRDITQTLAGAINAAKEQPPQVILIPAPQQPTIPIPPTAP